MSITWKLVLCSLSELKEHPRNPRVLKKDQAAHLKLSLEKFGIADKPIINQDYTIIGGHQRLKVLKSMKVKEIECWYPDRMLDEKEVDELNIRLNKNTGEFDFDILANEWNLGDLIEWGFTAKDLEGAVPEVVDPIITDEEKPAKQKECPNCGHPLN